MVTVKVNNVEVEMVVDTGASTDSQCCPRTAAQNKNTAQAKNTRLKHTPKGRSDVAPQG